MASVSYISITGNKQGLISAGCSDQESIGNKSQTAHKDEIMVLAYEHDLATNSNGSSAGGRAGVANTCRYRLLRILINLPHC